MRHEFEMSEADLEKIADACKPVVCIKVGNYSPSTPQENANRAWAALGQKMGFRPMTARPIPGKGNRFFSAEVVEVEQEAQL